jgi:hypothetical protein
MYANISTTIMYQATAGRGQSFSVFIVGLGL